MCKMRGDIMVNGVPRKVPRPKPVGLLARGFWPQDFLRDSIHDTPKVFPHIFILLSSRTSKHGFLSPNGLPREYHGQYLYFTALHCTNVGRVKYQYTSPGCRKNGTRGCRPQVCWPRDFPKGLHSPPYTQGISI